MNHYFAYRSFLPEFQTMRKFNAAGVDTICLFPANTMNSLGEPYSQYSANWVWFDRYDFKPVAQQFNDILKINPNIKILCMIDLNSPAWLARQLNLSHESGDSMTHLTECLANPRWLEATEHYLDAFLDYCESNYADNIYAYIPACGNTDEWFDHNGEICGLNKERAFRQYCVNRSLPETVPPSACEMNSPHFDELVFDPSKASRVFSYRRFCNELVAEAIQNFVARIKKRVHRKVETGVFFGYLTTRVGIAESGHVELKRLLDSPDIDFIISPGTYNDREIGGGSGTMSASGSEKLAGKRHLHECDQRTHTYNPHLSPNVSLEFPCWRNTTEDIAGMKRELAFCAINDLSLWWFDMWGGFYQEPELTGLIHKFKSIYELCTNETTENICETVLVIDQESCYYFDQRSPRQAEFQRHLQKMLNRLGAPYETYLFDDLPRIPNREKIKLFIFANLIEITPEKEELLKRFVLTEDRCVFWLYAPGLSNGKNLDPQNIELYTGCVFGTPGYHWHNHGSWRSCYLCRSGELTASSLRKIAVKAGISFIVDAELPVYANNRFFAVHTADAGTCEIFPPIPCDEVSELFSGQKQEVRNGFFKWEFTGPDSVIFLMNSVKQEIV